MYCKLPGAERYGYFVALNPVIIATASCSQPMRTLLHEPIPQPMIGTDQIHDVVQWNAGRGPTGSTAAILLALRMERA